MPDIGNFSFDDFDKFPDGVKNLILAGQPQEIQNNYASWKAGQEQAGQEQVREEPDISQMEEVITPEPVPNRTVISPENSSDPEISTEEKTEEREFTRDDIPELDIERDRTFNEYKQILAERGWQPTQEINQNNTTPDLWKKYTHELFDVANIEAIGCHMLTHIEDEGNRVGVVIDNDNSLLGIKFLRYQSGINHDNELSVEAVESLKNVFPPDSMLIGKSGEEQMKALGYTYFKEPVYSLDSDTIQPQPAGYREGYQYGDPNNPEQDLTIRIYLPQDPDSNDPAKRNFSFDIINNRNLGMSKAELNAAERYQQRTAKGKNRRIEDTEKVPFDYDVGFPVHFSPDENPYQGVMKVKAALLASNSTLCKSPSLQHDYLKGPTPEIDSSKIPDYVNEIAKADKNPAERYLSAGHARKLAAENYNILKSVIEQFHNPDFSPEARKAFHGLNLRVPDIEEKDNTSDPRTAFASAKKLSESYQTEILGNDEFPGELKIMDLFGQSEELDQELKAKLGIRNLLLYPNPGQKAKIEAGDQSRNDQGELTKGTLMDVDLSPRFDPKRDQYTKTINGHKYINREEEYLHSDLNSFMSFDEFAAYSRVAETQTNYSDIKNARTTAVLQALTTEERIQAGIWDEEKHTFNDAGKQFLESKSWKQLNTARLPSGKTVGETASDKDKLAGASIGLAFASYDANNKLLARRKEFSQQVSSDVNQVLKGKNNQLLRHLVDQHYLPEELRPDYGWQNRITQANTLMQKTEEYAQKKLNNPDIHFYTQHSFTGFPAEGAPKNEPAELLYTLVDKSQPTGETADGKTKYKTVTAKDLGFKNKQDLEDHGFSLSVKKLNAASTKAVELGAVNARNIITDGEKVENTIYDDPKKKSQIFGGSTRNEWNKSGINPDRMMDTYSKKPYDLRANQDMSDHNDYSYENAIEKLGSAEFTQNREFQTILVDDGKQAMSVLPDAANLMHALNTLMDEQAKTKAREQVMKHPQGKQAETIAPSPDEEEIREACAEIKQARSKKMNNWKNKGQL